MSGVAGHLSVLLELRHAAVISPDCVVVALVALSAPSVAAVPALAAAAPKMRLLLAALLPTTAAMPKYFTFYGNDAVNQHSWSNVGTAGLPDIIGAPPHLSFGRGGAECACARCVREVRAEGALVRRRLGALPRLAAGVPPQRIVQL